MRKSKPETGINPSPTNSFAFCRGRVYPRPSYAATAVAQDEILRRHSRAFGIGAGWLSLSPFLPSPVILIDLVFPFIDPGADDHGNRELDGFKGRLEQSQLWRNDTEVCLLTNIETIQAMKNALVISAVLVPTPYIGRNEA